MRVVCPRCGRLGSLSWRKIGGNTYYYVVHYDPAARKTKQCYLGPREYRYVAKLQGVPLHGLVVSLLQRKKTK